MLQTCQFISVFCCILSAFQNPDAHIDLDLLTRSYGNSNALFIIKADRWHTPSQ